MASGQQRLQDDDDDDDDDDFFFDKFRENYTAVSLKQICFAILFC